MNWAIFIALVVGGLFGVGYRYVRDRRLAGPPDSPAEVDRRERIAESETRAWSLVALYLALMVAMWMAITINDAGDFATWSAGTTLLVVAQASAIFFLLRRMFRGYRSVMAPAPPRPANWGIHSDNNGVAMVGWISAVLLPFLTLIVAFILAWRRDTRSALVVLLAVVVWSAIVIVTG